MSANTRGLGRGLDALLGGSRTEDVGSSEVSTLPIGSLQPNPHQPRKEFQAEKLQDLADSIKAQGVLQPVLVRPLSGGKYELVAGERRLRASKMAGLKEIPVLIREMSDQESLAIALIENLQREDLNAIEEAKGYQQLQQQFGLSQEELAKYIGKSRSTLANAMRLLNLPASIQKDIQDNVITAGHGRALMSVPEDVAVDLHKRIVGQGLSVRQAEGEATFWKENDELPSAGEGTSAAAGVEKASKPSGSKALDESLVSIQEKLAEKYQVKVKVVGSPEKGGVTFQFSSPEELDILVGELGLD